MEVIDIEIAALSGEGFIGLEYENYLWMKSKLAKHWA